MTSRLTMSSDELDEFYALRPNEGEAWRFWKRIAQRHGVDFAPANGPLPMLRQVAANEFRVGYVKRDCDHIPENHPLLTNCTRLHGREK